MVLGPSSSPRGVTTIIYLHNIHIYNCTVNYMYFSLKNIVLFLHQPPKFYNTVFLFVANKLWGLQLNFNCPVHQFMCTNISTTYLNLQMRYFSVSILGIYINLSDIVLSLQIHELIVICIQIQCFYITFKIQCFNSSKKQYMKIL